MAGGRTGATKSKLSRARAIALAALTTLLQACAALQEGNPICVADCHVTLNSVTGNPALTTISATGTRTDSKTTTETVTGG